MRESTETGSADREGSGAGRSQRQMREGSEEGVGSTCCRPVRPEQQNPAETGPVTLSDWQGRWEAKRPR